MQVHEMWLLQNVTGLLQDRVDVDLITAEDIASHIIGVVREAVLKEIESTVRMKMAMPVGESR